MSEWRGHAIVGPIATVIATVALGIAAWGIQRSEELSIQRVELQAVVRRVEAVEAHMSRVDIDRREIVEALSGMRASLASQSATLSSISDRIRAIEERIVRR